jgi:trimethylamine--corrinoid protein Co-methyltransferase
VALSSLPASDFPLVTPREVGWTRLSPGDISLIHEAALELLATTGVVFGSADALTILAKAGASVDGQRVQLSRRLVDDALETAPSRFTLTTDRPNHDLTFGVGESAVATAAGPPFVIDREGVRLGTAADCVAMVALAQVSANIDMVACAPEPQDLPPADRHNFALYATLAFSDKPLVHSVSTAEQLLAATETAEILHGATWSNAVRLVAVVNSMSPLLFDEQACRSIVTLARRGQAVCVTPCVMGGTTGPATLAGILTLQHAEVLAGLVLSQTAGAGSPFVYGGTSSVSSMTSGMLMVGVPQFWQLIGGTAELARHLRLPSRTGGSLTDAHLPDIQAGVEGGLSLAASILGGTDLILHGTGILSSFNALSFAKFIVDDETVGMVKAALVPIEVSPETIALEVLEAVGPAGNFLTQSHTRRHCRDGVGRTCFNRRPRELWAADGSRGLADMALLRAQEAIASYEAPALDPVTMRQLQRYCLGDRLPSACDVGSVLATTRFGGGPP